MPKTIRSNRLGIEYRKEISYSSRLKGYYVVCSDFCRFSHKTHCVSRFERLTRSPRSNDALRLITANKRSTSVRCKHNAHTDRYQRPVIVDIDVDASLQAQMRSPSPPSPHVRSISLTDWANRYFHDLETSPSPPPPPLLLPTESVSLTELSHSYFQTLDISPSPSPPSSSSHKNLSFAEWKDEFFQDLDNMSSDSDDGVFH